MLPPIVCISNAAWDAPIPTNRQQLMRRFAQRTRVAYIEAPLPVLGAFVGRSRGRRRQRGWRHEDGVAVLQAWDVIPYPLTKRSPALSQWMDTQFRRYVADCWRQLEWPQPVLWLYTPDGGDLLGVFDERMSVYHCVDDYSAIERYNKYRRVAIYGERKREGYLVGAVDAVIVTSPPLLERWRNVNPHLYLMPNVADTSLFAQAFEAGPEHPRLAGISRPLVVFIGALDRYKVDFTLLEGVARRLPDVQFVCIGPIGSADNTRRDALPHIANVRYVGALPQHELPAALRYASAGIIPYLLNDYTTSVSPLKLYEYLAAGCPVVATPLPSLCAESVEGLLLAEPDPEVFASQLREALSYRPEIRRNLARQASAHSWDRRMEELADILEAHLAAHSPDAR